MANVYIKKNDLISASKLLERSFEIGDEINDRLTIADTYKLKGVVERMRKNYEKSLACFDTSGDTAESYCSELTLGGFTDWRLPMYVELVSLTNHARIDPALDAIFVNIAISSPFWNHASLVFGLFSAK